jgi:transcriptional regulator with XRE-family HTH domain
MRVTKKEKQDIAKRLRAARDDLGMTQAELAKKAGLGRSTVVHYENAAAIPGGVELIKIAKVLHKTPNYLLSGAEDFYISQEPEHALAGDDIEALVPRMTICIMVLDRDIREKMSELLMSLVKQKLNKKEYADFLEAMNMINTSMPDITSGAESLVDTLIDEGKLDIPPEEKKPKRAKKSKK